MNTFSMYFELFLRYRFKSAWIKIWIYVVVNSRPKEEKVSTNSVPIGRSQLCWWWHCQRAVLGQLYGVGSAPYTAVGAKCQSVTGVEPKFHCSTATRSTTESDSVTIFTVGCRSWYAISHPPNTPQQHYRPKPIKVSKPWVIQSSFIKVGHHNFATSAANIYLKIWQALNLSLRQDKICRVCRDDKVPLHWKALHGSWIIFSHG